MELFGRIKDWLSSSPPVEPPTFARKVSWEGVIEIAGHEGIVPAPYLDSVGVWTWGIGHTSAAGEPYPESMPRGMPKNVDAAIDEVLRVFGRDLEQYADRVRRAIKVPLLQHEFDALVSFDFNTGGIFRAKLTEAINAGEDDAARHFLGWLKPPEIRTRREAEARLFVSGTYSRKAVPVYRVDSNGKLRGLLTTMTDKELLERMT